MTKLMLTRSSNPENLPRWLIVHDAGIVDENADFESFDLRPNRIVHLEALREISDNDLGFHFVGGFCGGR